MDLNVMDVSESLSARYQELPRQIQLYWQFICRVFDEVPFSQLHGISFMRPHILDRELAY